MSDHIDLDPEVELRTADAAHDVVYMDDTDVMARWALIMQNPSLAKWAALTEEPDGTWRCSTTSGIVRRGNTQAAAVREFFHEVGRRHAAIVNEGRIPEVADGRVRHRSGGGPRARAARKAARWRGKDLEVSDEQKLTASRLKVTVVLSAGELLGIPAPDGTPRVVLRVQLPDRVVTADVAAKSVRKAQAAIRESGADVVALILQGALVAGDKITDAGLSAQPKAKPPKVAA